MGSLSKKLRSGLLELSTDSGPVYATPSIAERIYLLWTFRNFRRLPRQVLNQRQQQLIDRLSRSPSLRQRAPAAGARIIGVVENVRLAADRQAQAGKIIQMEKAVAKVEISRAVGSELSAIQRQTRAPIFDRPTDPPQPRVRSPFNIRNATPLRIFSEIGDARSRPGLKWVLVAAFAAALFALLFHFGRPTRSSVSSPAAENVRAVTSPPKAPAVEANQPVISRPLPKPSAARLKGQLQTSAIPVRIAAGLTTAAQPVVLATAAPLPSGNPAAASNAIGIPASPVPVVRAADQPAIASHEESNSRGEVRVAREVLPAPERVVSAAAPLSFDYPVAPSPKLIGRVRLKLFIAADGAVQEVRIISGNPVLADAAAAALRKWRYRPAQLDGHPAEAETNVTISFAGDDAVTIAYH